MKTKKEKRLFIPHITIARFTKETNNIHLDEMIDWSEKVTTITLFESHLSPRGATYTPITLYEKSHSLNEA